MTFSAWSAAAPSAIAAAAVATAWGWVGLAARPDGLVYAGYPLDEEAHAWEQLYGRFGPLPQTAQGDAAGLLDLAAAHFRAYFSGARVEVSALPVVLEGTPFEIKVWEATRAIPYGRTLAYGDVAWEVEHPLSARGVGRAMARTTAGLLVPCHRVIAAGGRLGGYGGREDRKERLLHLEGVRLRATAPVRTSRAARLPRRGP